MPSLTRRCVVAVPLALLLAGCGDPSPKAATVTKTIAPTPTPPPAPVARISSAELWQDLSAQRPAALVYVGNRLVVDLAWPAARAALELTPTSPWRLGQTLDDQQVGQVFGAGGSLMLPLDGDLAPALHPEVDGQPGLAVALTLRAHRPGQAMTVLWNEQPLANLQLGETWERRTLSLPTAAIKPGENRLRIHFSRPPGGGEPTASLRQVELGPRADIIAGPVAETPAYTVTTDASGEVGLQLATGTALAYYLVPPQRGRLRLDLRGRGNVRVRVSSDADHREGRPPTVLLDEPLRPGAPPIEVDLSGYAGLPLRLEVAVQSSGDDTSVLLRSLQLLCRRATPVDHRDRQLRDVYIIAVEGARPDDLFGVLLRGPRFPAVEEFVRSALVFERAYATAAWAVPSHSAVLSAMIPPVHATVSGTHVADAQVLLPEVLDRAGYHTLLVAANSDFDESRGLTQGFDAISRLSRTSAAGNHANVVMDAVLAGRGTKPPRFVYADMVDPQAPYDPPRELLAGLQTPPGAALPHLTHLWLGRIRIGAVIPDQPQRDYLRRLYRGELQRVDMALAALLTALTDDGSLDDAIVVLVGIHGEEFFEHDSVGHGYTLYEDSLRVPLAIRAPALLAPGRVSAPVDLLDLAPTLTDLLGLAFPTPWQGDSLLAVIDDPNPPPRLVAAYLGDGSRAAIVGDHKLILGSGRDSQKYFNLRNDPGEHDNRVDHGEIGLRIVRTAMAWELATPPGTWKRARWGTGADLLPAFTLDHGM